MSHLSVGKEPARSSVDYDYSRFGLDALLSKLSLDLAVKSLSDSLIVNLYFVGRYHAIML